MYSSGNVHAHVLMTCQFACVSSDWLARYMCSFEAQPPWWTLGRQAIHLPVCAGSRGSRWTPALLRRVSLKLTSEYFRGIWSSIRELVQAGPDGDLGRRRQAPRCSIGAHGPAAPSRWRRWLGESNLHWLQLRMLPVVG